MKPELRHAILAIGCLFLCACHGKNELTVLTKNFEGEVEQQQNLVFSFNKDVYPDSLLGVWDTTGFIQFTPAVRGSFKWNSSSELVFSPSEGFLPGTDYTAALTNQLLKHSKKKYPLKDDPIHFHTAPLLVANTHVSWMRGKNVANIMVQLDMEVNYPVKLSDIANRLKLSSNGTPISMTSVSSGDGKVLSVQFMPVNDLDQETPLKIELSKGVPIRGSKYVSAKDTSFTVQIPSRYNLSVTGFTAEHTGNEGVITVSTSQPVLENALKSLMSLEPSVPFEVTLNDAGFTITSSSLSVTQTYELSISSKLEGVFGGKMKSDYSEQVTFGKLKPSINFINSKGMYLSSAGYKNLALNIVNVPTVEVSVIKVYENNLEQFMRKDKETDYHYGEDNDGGEFEYYNTENLGDTIFHKTYETAKLPKQSSARILHLDFQDKIKDYNGVYVIRVSSKDHNWIQESKVVSISDIGMIVKEEKDNMLVFVNSIKNATAMQGVKVSFISTNNQKMYTATTDADGVAVFKKIAAQSPGFKVGMVTAKTNDEFSFVWLAKTQIGTSRFDVGGREANDAGLIAMIYAERNLYRPGETIHLSTVVRDEQWNNPGEIPVKIKLVMPNGKEFTTMRKILNEEGSCETSIAMPATVLTGSYTAEVYTGNDVLLNSYDISVEEFMPDRMKVALKLNKTEYSVGDNVVADIQADNLFGTPAADRNYECELNIDKGVFSSKNFSDYSFNVKNDFRFNEDMRNGKTDGGGKASQTFAITPDMANTGILNGNVTTTVFDETGRPVHRYEHFTVYTQPVFMGIKNGDDYVNTRTPMHMGLVAVDKNGNAQTTQAQVIIVKKEWHTVIQQDGNSYRYVSQNEEKVISQQKVRVSGTTTNFIFTPQQSGDYEIRVFLKGSDNYVSRQVYAYGWGDTEYTSFEVNNEGNVEIKADKDKYEQGEDMNLLFTTPFEGRILVTVEREHVIKYYYLNTQNKSAALSLKTDEAFLPNVYITATLFRPMGGVDMPLTVGHGFKSVTVQNKNTHLAVKIGVVAKARSKTRQTINIKTAPGAYVTVAAVDEGILQVKDFETPDPYKYFYQKTALSVNSYDIYPWLLPEIKTTLSSTGGDAAKNGNANRVNPMFVNRVKLVSFWSGIIQADGGGNARFDIDVPQFSGDIRVMAYAYKGRAFGAADQHIKIADPVVISTALPRFLSPKDEVVMPVSLSNTTAKDMRVTVTVLLKGPLAVNGESVQSITIPANREQRVVFNITAANAIGAGKVTVSVKTAAETFINETDIGIRPPASLQKITESGYAAEGNTDISLKNNFIPSSVAGKLLVSKSPLVQFSKNLSYLVHYPYGCVEQTTSAAFPQLYYNDIVKSIGDGEDKNMNTAYNVQQAINKLQSMQLNDGALSYWPEGGSESWWGSIYATHFLIEARKAGYEVNGNTIDRLLQYMKYKLNSKETVTYYYNNHQRKDIAAEEVPYSLYVLALAGQSQPATMNYYKAHQELLALDGKYLLSAAYSLSGQPTQARDVLPSAFEGEKADRTFSGSFSSYIRDEALALDVLVDADPNNRQVGIMARQLSQQMKTDPYLNTQENAFGMLALGKIARIANKTTATATVMAGGKVAGSTQGANISIDLKNLINKPMQVQVKGKGGYYYFNELSGITTDGTYKQEDSYLKVRRTYFDRDGREITTNTFKQNDLVVVRLSIEAAYSGTIDNVAITDMLPAGFEIENSRLSEMPNLKWVKEEAEPDYRDIRDDRINMFTSVSQVKKNFYYMVRAVSPGVYQLGPVQADAMYDGSYHSYNGAGVVHITDK